jgi:hypothetical protein
MAFKEYLLESFGINEPIYIKDICFENYSRSWIFAELKKLVDSGELRRFDRGIYYFPKMYSWGEAIPDTDKIIERRFITDGNDVYGYITGDTLLNEMGFTTQVPFLKEIATNRESARVRDVYIGYRRVLARKSRAEITKDNVATLQLLDLMNVIQAKEKMSEKDIKRLKRYVVYYKNSSVTKQSLYKYANIFPKNATTNLIESGVIYDFA